MKKGEFFYNCHTHRRPQSEVEVCIRNAFLENISEFYPSYFMSSGVHPWHVSGYNDSEMRSKLAANLVNRKVIAVGEIGLDKLSSDFNRQKRFFKLQLELASDFHLPVIIHQVKSVNEINEVLAGFPEPVILHGFNGHPDVWEQLSKKHKTYVSFGKALLNPSEKLIESIQRIPIRNILLETDNSVYTIQEVYQKFCTIREISILDLKAGIENNFLQVFNPKI